MYVSGCAWLSLTVCVCVRVCVCVCVCACLCCRGLYFDKHLKFIQLNNKFVPFTRMDLSYLEKVRVLFLPLHLPSPPSRFLLIVSVCCL